MTYEFTQVDLGGYRLSHLRGGGETVLLEAETAAGLERIFDAVKYSLLLCFLPGRVAALLGGGAVPCGSAAGIAGGERVLSGEVRAAVPCPASGGIDRFPDWTGAIACGFGCGTASATGRFSAGEPGPDGHSEACGTADG